MQKFDRTFLRAPVVIAILIVIGVVSLWALFVALRPLPARDLAIATGPVGGAYMHVAERYREILARDGVRLRLVTSSGAIDNLARLRDPRAGVAAGFVQAGTTTEAASPELVSLGTVFNEPLWVFSRNPNLAALLAERPNAKVSIGLPGSATRPLALKLLTLVGVDSKKLQFVDSPPESAAHQLSTGELDIVVILSAWEAPAVQQLLREPGVELVTFRRAAALVALDPNFSKVVLPEGVVDLATNRPPADVALIASKASLVVRKDLHPALQYLLLHAAIEVHGRPGMFQRGDEFPAPEVVDLPLSTEARHMYKSGPSILQRTLPFWLAELVQRALVLLLPIAGIVYPLWSLLPKIYRWQMQRRIFRLYGQLRFLESELGHCKDADERARIVTRIEHLERRVLQVKVPTAFSEMIFTLRRHIRALLETGKVV